MVYFVSVFLIVSLACLVFLSRATLYTMIETERASLVDVKHVFNAASNSAVSITQTLTAFNSSVNVAACRNALKTVQKYSTVESYVSISKNQINQVSNLVTNHLTPKIEFVQSYMDETIPYNTNVAFWVYWAGILFWNFILIFVFFCRSKCLLTFTMVTTEFFIVVLAIISSALVLIVHTTADVCLDPAMTVRTVVNAMNLPSDVSKIATYYTTCNGKSCYYWMLTVSSIDI